ncbi:Uncharacterised protein [Acinetobacter baumannii]|nr:Uncharacterised protein [Acinetobacter baumannii]
MERLIELRLGLVARRVQGIELGFQLGAVEADQQVALLHLVAAPHVQHLDPALGLGGNDDVGGVRLALQQQGRIVQAQVEGDGDDREDQQRGKEFPSLHGAGFLNTTGRW